MLYELKKHSPAGAPVWQGPILSFCEILTGTCSVVSYRLRFDSAPRQYNFDKVVSQIFRIYAKVYHFHVKFDNFQTKLDTF